MDKNRIVRPVAGIVAAAGEDLDGDDVAFLHMLMPGGDTAALVHLALSPGADQFEQLVVAQSLGFGRVHAKNDRPSPAGGVDLETRRLARAATR